MTDSSHHIGLKPPKFLYILNFAGQVNNFSFAAIEAAKRLGMDCHIAGCWRYENDEARLADGKRLGLTIHQIDFLRNPFALGNRRAYRQLDQLMSREGFDLVHTNTPIGGALGRLAAKKHRVLHVIYQVHGFHFYRGSSPLNWLVFYPIEKLLARQTDTLITINSEDFALAQKRFKTRRGGEILFVPGVGIDVGRIADLAVDRAAMKQVLGLPDEAFMMLSVGELNANKNQAVVVKAMPSLPGLHYVIAGQGDQNDALLALAQELKVADRLHLVGFRSDVPQLLKTADAFCLPSLREGLSAAVMEAMAASLPLVISDIRGNRDLLPDGRGGFLIAGQDPDAYARALSALMADAALKAGMGAHNREAIKAYDHRVIIDQMAAIYTRALKSTAPTDRG